MSSPFHGLFISGHTSRDERKANLTACLIIAAIICAQGAPLTRVHAQTGALFLVSTTSPPTTPQTATNRSTLTVFVGVKDGRLVVDRAKSADGFNASEEFLRRLGTGLSAAQVNRALSTFRETLFDDLDTRFRSLDKIYRYALNDQEKAKEPDDELTMKVRSFPGGAALGDWAEFSELFDRWATTEGADRFEIKQVFSKAAILQNLNTVSRETALTFNPDAPPPRRSINIAQGSLRFNVSDPIDFSQEGEYKISFPNEPDDAKKAAKRKIIFRLLKSFQGKLWRGTQLKSAIEEYYAERGLVGTVRISPAGKEPREITIPEGARIARLVFHKDVPDNEIDKLAYLLLPDKQYRVFAKTRPLERITVKDEAGNEVESYRVVDLGKLGTAQGAEPFFNQYGFQISQLELSQLGFAAANGQTPEEVRAQNASGSSYVDIYVFKAEEEEEKGEKPDNVPEKALPVADEAGLVLARRGGKSGSVTDFVPPVNVSPPPPTTDADATVGGAPANGTPSPTPGSAQAWHPKDKKNYIGGGLSYKSGQGVRFLGFAQRERLGLLSSQDAFSLQGGAQDEALGTLNYYSDFVLFNALGHRRVSLQLTGKSDFNARRFFQGVETDERRTGGLLRIELERFRDRADSMLRFYVEGRHATVQLLQDDKTVSKQNLTTLDIGGIYLYENRIAFKPKRLRLEPRLRVGLGLAADEPQFTSFFLAGNYHQQLSRALEADLNGRVEFASARTPLYELPSLGGVDILRGFREDDALGRRLWSLQSELWTVLPGTAGAESGFRKFLRRQVRMAGFLDVGGVYETIGSEPGVRFGPGIGARIIYRPAIIKLDWAYGIGDAATTGRGRGRFYFSVGTNLPF